MVIHAQAALHEVMLDAAHTQLGLQLITLSGQPIATLRCSLCVTALPAAAARHMGHQLRIEASLHPLLLHAAGIQALQEALHARPKGDEATSKPAAARPPVPPSRPPSLSAVDAIVGSTQPPPLYFHNGAAPSMVILPPPQQDAEKELPAASASSDTPASIAAHTDSTVHASDATVTRVDELLCELIRRVFDTAPPPPRSAFSPEAVRLAQVLGRTATARRDEASPDAGELEVLLPRVFQALRSVREERAVSSPQRHQVQRTVSPRVDRDVLPPRIPDTTPMEVIETASITTPSTAAGSVTGVRLSRALRIKIAAVEEQRRAERVAAARSSNARARWSGDAAVVQMTASAAVRESSASATEERGRGRRSDEDTTQLRGRLLLPHTEGSGVAQMAAAVSPRNYQSMRDAQRAIGMSPRRFVPVSARSDAASVAPPPPPPPPEAPIQFAKATLALAPVPLVPHAPESPLLSSPRRRQRSWEATADVPSASPRAALLPLSVNESTISSAGSGDGRVNDSGNGAKLTEPSLTGMDMQISEIGASSTLVDVDFPGENSAHAISAGGREISAITDGTLRSISGDSMASLSMTDADGTRSGDAWGATREEELGATTRLPAGVVTLRRDASASGSTDFGATLSASSSLAGVQLVGGDEIAAAFTGTMALSDSMGTQVTE